MAERNSLEFTEKLNGPFIAKVREWMKENDVTSFKMGLILLANKGLSK